MDEGRSVLFFFSGAGGATISAHTLAHNSALPATPSTHESEKGKAEIMHAHTKLLAKRHYKEK